MIFFKRSFFLTSVLVVVTILSACSTAVPTQAVMVEKETSGEMVVKETAGEMVEENDSEMSAEEASSHPETTDEMGEEKPNEAAMEEAEGSDGAAEDKEVMENAGPAFLSAALTDAASGETFAFSDFRGKVVLVETMAMWCSNCYKQQSQVKALHDLIGENDDFVSVGIDIDLNEELGDLKEYVMNNGFDWWYAVASKEVAREISQVLGDQYLNPPSTPMFIIDREGEVHPLNFGIKSAEELLQSLEPFLASGSN